MASRNYTIIHNPRCRKSREALKSLEEKNINPEIRLYLEKNLSKEELKEILAKLNVTPESIIRKTEKDYKENFKGKQLTDEEWIETMLKFPKLIQRPIIITGSKAVIARNSESIAEILN